MLTLYHAPFSRSTRIVQLIELMGISDRIDLRIVQIVRSDGSGVRDAINPHPEGKVPLLVHDGVSIRETSAIMEHLMAVFPEEAARVAPRPGTPEHGAMLAWMAWSGAVLEPLVLLKIAAVEHPLMHSTFRDMDQALALLEKALMDRRFLMGAHLTPADILASSSFPYLPGGTPEHPAITDWLARCEAEPSSRAAAAFDAKKAKSAA
ncbi:glutathione S-transferase family protein [Ponticoccus alexandrii]|uniref:Glutathione S-transferase n=1 Tax=Ponticoccus alexandrii TaxID=1943633 RepID=A0ABX7F8Z5_9RHOB|nr:glutathione S-transferase family protein [Ponticoccus alexandrii]ETA52157.1 glutathione S-transferase [Rhodobacteraceae bacterium PD-2]QRF66964.1 glutathione S-transferase [Ponticoccus alexandrii]